MPTRDRFRRPLRGFVRMAGVACIWRPDFFGEVGTRNGERMVVPSIHNHIGASRHMTGDAIRRAGRSGMPGMFYLGETLRLMALGADPASGGFELAGMRIVTIAANHALGVH